MVTSILFIIMTVIMWAISGGDITSLYVPVFNISTKTGVFVVSGADIFMLITPIIMGVGFFTKSTVKGTASAAIVPSLLLIALLTNTGLLSAALIELIICSSLVLAWGIKQLGESNATINT